MKIVAILSDAAILKARREAEAVAISTWDAPSSTASDPLYSTCARRDRVTATAGQMSRLPCFKPDVWKGGAKQVFRQCVGTL